MGHKTAEPVTAVRDCVSIFVKPLDGFWRGTPRFNICKCDTTRHLSCVCGDQKQMYLAGSRPFCPKFGDTRGKMFFANIYSSDRVVCVLSLNHQAFIFLFSTFITPLNWLHLCPFLISSTKICWRGNLFTPLLCVSPFKSHVLCILSPLSLQLWHLIIPFCPRATNLLSDASC